MAFPRSLVAAMVLGKGKTMNGRLLLRAVSLGEINESSGGKIDLSAVKDKAGKAPFHVVVAVGDGVPPGFAKPGDLCLHISAAADIADPTEPNTPYTFVRHDHIVCCVDPAVAIEAEAEMARKIEEAMDEARRKANGL